MAGIINRFDIPTYNASLSYIKFDAVHTTYSGVEKYFVCIQDTTAGTLPTISVSNLAPSNAYWYPMYSFDIDISDIWKPTYSTSVNVNPPLWKAQFNDGHLAQRSRNIIHPVPFDMEAIWENISYTEAKSLLAFFELRGSSESFLFTLPEPYNKQKRFIVNNYSVSFDRWNLCRVTAILRENFDIIGGTNAESTGDPNI